MLGDRHVRIACWYLVSTVAPTHTPRRAAALKIRTRLGPKSQRGDELERRFDTLWDRLSEAEREQFGFSRRKDIRQPNFMERGGQGASIFNTIKGKTLLALWAENDLLIK